MFIIFEIFLVSETLIYMQQSKAEKNGIPSSSFLTVNVTLLHHYFFFKVPTCTCMGDMRDCFVSPCMGDMRDCFVSPCMGDIRDCFVRATGS